MQKEQLILLAEKYLNRTATEDEQQLLHQWYDRWDDDEEQVLVSDGQTADSIRERILARVKQEIDKESVTIAPVHRIHFLKTSWFRYAAAIILIAGAATAVGIFINNRSANLPEAWGSKGKTDITPGINKAILTIGNDKPIDLATNKSGITVSNSITYTDGEKIADAGEILQLKTPRGGQYQAVLPDGTKVWLNAASSIKFPSKFTGNERSVEIDGEVYLEVSKNSNHPFFVHTNRTTIEVLGTSFNVNAYADEESDKTTLIDGSVKVKSDKEGVILKPGQQAIINNQVNQRLVVQTTDVDKVMAWKNGFFNFTGADLLTVMHQLERWYDIQVKYEGEIPKFSFRGRLDRNVNLSEVLDILDKMGVKFKVEGRTLTVSGDR